MSHVALEKNICEICGCKHSNNCGLLLHTHFKDIPEDKTITGYGLCEPCEELSKDYLTLIEINAPDSVDTDTETSIIKFSEAERTGRLFRIKIEVAKEMFNIFDLSHKFVFIDTQLGDELQRASITTIH